MAMFSNSVAFAIAHNDDQTLSIVGKWNRWSAPSFNVIDEREPTGSRVIACATYEQAEQIFNELDAELTESEMLSIEYGS